MRGWFQYGLGVLSGVVLCLIAALFLREGPTGQYQATESAGPSQPETSDDKDQHRKLWKGDLPKMVVEEFEVANGSVGDCFLKLADSKGVPIGLELLPGDDLRGAVQLPDGTPAGKAKRFSLAKRDTSLKEVLDGIVAADPRYEWDDLEGVINIRPRAADRTDKSPLDDRIDVFVAIDFSFRDVINLVASPWDRLDYLLAIMPAEAQEARLEFDRFPSMKNMEAAEKVWTEQMTFVLLQPSLCDIMNAVLRRQRKGCWVCWAPMSTEPGGDSSFWELTLCPDEDYYE